MLDLAFGLTDTSRLGCQVARCANSKCANVLHCTVQVCMTKELDGVVVKVPEGVNDQR
jgi:hypothetical protein